VETSTAKLEVLAASACSDSTHASGAAKKKKKKKASSFCSVAAAADAANEAHARLTESDPAISVSTSSSLLGQVRQRRVSFSDEHQVFEFQEDEAILRGQGKHKGSKGSKSKKKKGEHAITLDGENSQQWKEKGDRHCRAGEYQQALECYHKAIQIASSKLLPAELLNRAICYLQLGQYEECIQDCTGALMLLHYPNDNKHNRDSTEGDTSSGNDSHGQLHSMLHPFSASTAQHQHQHHHHHHHHHHHQHQQPAVAGVALGTSPPAGSSLLERDSISIVRALVRRGAAFAWSHQYRQAREDYAAACVLQPENADLQKDLMAIDEVLEVIADQEKVSRD